MRVPIASCSALLALSCLAQPDPDTLHWSAARPVQAADFHMEPQTWSGLAGEAFCLLAAAFNKPNAFVRTQFNVVASFDRAKSWINPGADQQAMVAYFQVMFDLHELHARRLKKVLDEQAPKGDPSQFMQDRYHAAMAELMEDNARMRKETRMGTDAAGVRAAPVHFPQAYPVQHLGR